MQSAPVSWALFEDILNKHHPLLGCRSEGQLLDTRIISYQASQVTDGNFRRY